MANHLPYTVEVVPAGEIMRRLGIEPDRIPEIYEIYVNGWTEWPVGVNSYSLVPWEVFMDDMVDLMLDMGYNQVDVVTNFPRDIFHQGVYADLEDCGELE